MLDLLHLLPQWNQQNEQKPQENQPRYVSVTFFTHVKGKRSTFQSRTELTCLVFLTFSLYLQKITTKETTASAVGPKVMMFLIRGERVGAIKVGHLQAQAHLAIWKGYLISIHQFFPLRNSIIFHFKIVAIFLHPPFCFNVYSVEDHGSMEIFFTQVKFVEA